MSSVKLTGNFLATARCLIFSDGGGITWTFNSNTNTLQASGSGGGVTGLATPTASVGLATVAGSATTAMRSDAAPSLSQAIIPTWTGLHTFSAGLTVSAGTVTINTHTLTLSANATIGGTNTGDQAIPAAANPTATVNLSGANGVATTFMRSDAAPALSVAISPTWSGSHTFQNSTTFQGGATFSTGSAATCVAITAANGQAGLVVNATGGYFAAKFLAGTFPALYATGASAGSAFMEVNTSATTGTKTAAMTATNKPGTNNQTTPAVWLPINCDGTIYYFPGYAA